MERVLIAVVLGLGMAGCGASHDSLPRRSPPSAADTSPARLITELPGNSFRVGRYAVGHVFRFTQGAPTSLSDVEAALGHQDTCSWKLNNATVRWPTLDITGQFTTLGAFSDAAGHPLPGGAATGCDHRDQIQVDRLTATGAHWHTREGLKIGDPLTRLLDLYPRAVQNGRVWWLHTIRTPFGGQQTPDMTATVSNGAVTAITVIIGAEGD